jgi:hypothetical protein
MPEKREKKKRQKTRQETLEEENALTCRSPFTSISIICVRAFGAESCARISGVSFTVECAVYGFAISSLTTMSYFKEM